MTPGPANLAKAERALPAHVRHHPSGGRGSWSPPLPLPPPDRVAAVRRCLGEVLDPELPVSIVDLGLVYDVEVENASARVSITYTATACPCMEFIREDIRDRLLREEWLDEAEIVEVWDPPWTTGRISASGRRALRRLGVAS